MMLCTFSPLGPAGPEGPTGPVKPCTRKAKCQYEIILSCISSMSYKESFLCVHL